MPHRIVYVAYEGADRPLCDLCGLKLRKRAVFFDRRQQRALCARCVVVKIHANAFDQLRAPFVT